MMKLTILTAAALSVLAATPAAAQTAPVDRSQDMAWHSQQQLALASRSFADGWSYEDGGVLWRRVAGDGSGESPTVADRV
ncbi:MAG: FKBP-type peptidyl-prolyl cis-trans isomerase, partial [Pontixanthobacter sp.]